MSSASPLVQLRQAVGLARSDVARELAVSESSVWRWEAGARAFPVRYAVQLAAVYRVPVAVLVEAAARSSSDGQSNREVV